MNKLVKRIVATSLAVLMVGASFAGCSGNTGNGGSNSSEVKTFKVGICQYDQFDALNDATQGFKDKLTELIEKDGDKVEFDYQNGSSDQNALATITTKFVTDKVDLIMANATPVVQAAMTATASSQIPVVGVSVTDYGAATGLAISGSQATGINVTGASDLAPLAKQAEQIVTLFPDAKNVGCIYCSSEPNSIFQVEGIKAELAKSGVTANFYSFTDSNDLAGIAKEAAAKSDVIYVPTDNPAAKNASIIGQACSDANVPIIAGEAGIYSKTKAVATFSISYYEMGQAAGEMAYNILEKGADPATMNIWLSENATYYYNDEVAKKFNVTIPEGYEISK